MDFSSRRFPWPKKLKKDGTFWINYFSEKKIINKIKILKKMKKQKWIITSKYYQKNIMPFNFRNRKLNETINNILKIFFFKKNILLKIKLLNFKLMMILQKK